MLKNKRIIIGWVIVVLIFAIIGKELYTHWDEIPFERLEFNYYFLLLSGIFYGLAFLVGAFAWKYNLMTLNEKISYKNSLEILSLTQLGRYLPGKIWFAVGRAWMGKHKGIKEHNVIISVILETVIIFLAAFLVFLTFGVPLANYKFLPYFSVPLFLFFGFLFIQPKIFAHAINFGLRLLKKNPIAFSLNYYQIFLLLLFYLVIWILYGVSFYLLIRSFYNIPLSMVAPLTGIHAFAWIIGFISLLTPGGLGVREGALSLLLTFYLPTSLGIPVALLARAWCTIIEVIFFGIFAKKMKGYFVE